ncbi:hypothetical protein TcasGA2_TC011487 [Tribolium castaneum]|uniref:DUF5641 domain-containing protein n=1 Tax=Tribolium castaneum TaxID=7070 RepID=D7EK83_TRICA|nr:hypothetical protein TcasGA2_TC011487 [Tribolium castaneum]
MRRPWNNDEPIDFNIDNNVMDQEMVPTDDEQPQLRNYVEENLGTNCGQKFQYPVKCKSVPRGILQREKFIVAENAYFDAYFEALIKLSDEIEGSSRNKESIRAVSMTPREDEDRQIKFWELEEVTSKKKFVKKSSIKRSREVEKKFMQEYLDMGHMVRVPESQEFQGKYYIPHQAVIREESTTTKLRVVFDASCKISSGTDEKNFNVGELVLIKEDNINPSKWPLAKIKEVHPGGDGVVRVVTLERLEKTTDKRSIHCLIPLPRENEELEQNQKPSKKCGNTVALKNKAKFTWRVSIIALLFITTLTDAAKPLFKVQYPKPGIYIEHLGEAKINRGTLN